MAHRWRKRAAVWRRAPHEVSETPCRVRDEGTCFEPTVKSRGPLCSVVCIAPPCVGRA